MGRKNLLLGLSEEKLPAGNSEPPIVPEPTGTAPHLTVMSSRSPIGAVTRSIEQMRANAVADLATELIEASPIADRLASSEEAHRALTDSIREHGQQVPILVRPHPDKEGRYQIAYGRRRLRALSELGRSVRAVIKPLTDRQLVVAQGQENSARTDLSFIERALFAAKLEESSFDRETIMAALSVDKTGLSRLISAASKVPRLVIEAIGPAPGAGRDRWIELAARLSAPETLERVRQIIGSENFVSLASDERFIAVFGASAERVPRAPRPVMLKGSDGTRIARLTEDEAKLTVTIDKKAIGNFAAYLIATLPDIYANFKARGGEPPGGKADGGSQRS